MSHAASRPDKRALLIGVNKYPLLARHYQLRGCVNDVELMAAILRDNFAFPEANIQLLRDEEATRDGILAALDALAADTGRDDIVVVHYSGHGSQRTAQYPELEPDKLDETIVPYDSGRDPQANRDITDKELHAWLLRLRDITPNVTFLFDCCHSGTIVRRTFRERGVEADRRPLAEMQLAASRVDFRAAERASRDLGDSGWLPLADRYVLIAGCQDKERSFEHVIAQRGLAVSHGALTYFLGQELVRARPGTTYRDVFERTSAQVKAAYPGQHPQMEGARDRELFGVTGIEPRRFVPVTARQGNQVTLAGGAAHGLAAGSQWAIYPQGTKDFTDETRRLGLVEVKAVRAITSDAEIVEEPEPGTIAPDTRAVEEAHSYGEMRLVVEIQAPAGYDDAVTELAARIEDSDLLRQAEEGEEGQVRAYLIAPRPGAGEDDPVPQLGALAMATWAVVGRDERLMMPSHPITKAGVAYVLRDNLEKRARYQHGLALRNADDEGPLQGKVRFVLMRLAPDGTWVEAEPDERSGQIVYQEEDRIAFRITNNYTSPIYVSVLDFGLRGGIGLLHPIAGAGEELVPGHTIEVGVREGDELELYFPEGFFEVLDPEEGVPQGGLETFKLLATTHPADFSLLVQEGYRGADPSRRPGADSPLGQLLNMALTGRGTRQVRRKRLRPDEEWTTVERSFFLVPRGTHQPAVAAGKEVAGSTADPAFSPLAASPQQAPPSRKALSDPQVRAVIQDNTSFALDLYGQLGQAGGNLFFSPYSISTALAMTYAGARGNTERQMAQALHFSVGQEQLHPALAALQARLQAVQDRGQIRLSAVNSLWPDARYPFLPEYLALIEAHYGVRITPVDYRQATEQARRQINAWVEQETENKIQDLLQPGDLNVMTRLVLANAIYFKGDWSSPFDRQRTADAPFWVTPEDSVTVPMMTQTGEFGYAAGGGLEVLELPYAGRDLSMVILLPRALDGLARIEGDLSRENLERWLRSLEACKVEVSLPRFKLTYRRKLCKTLSAMGMPDAFDEAEADFSGMDGLKGPLVGLFIALVIHQAFVEVNEEGTEAAASTAVVIEERSMPGRFRADHPFLFLIRDRATGSILFMGRLADPASR